MPISSGSGGTGKNIASEKETSARIPIAQSLSAKATVQSARSCSHSVIRRCASVRTSTSKLYVRPFTTAVALCALAGPSLAVTGSPCSSTTSRVSPSTTTATGTAGVGATPSMAARIASCSSSAVDRFVAAHGGEPHRLARHRLRQQADVRRYDRSELRVAARRAPVGHQHRGDAVA